MNMFDQFFAPKFRQPSSSSTELSDFSQRRELPFMVRFLFMCSVQSVQYNVWRCVHLLIDLSFTSLWSQFIRPIITRPYHKTEKQSEKTGRRACLDCFVRNQLFHLICVLWKAQFACSGFACFEFACSEFARTSGPPPLHCHHQHHNIYLFRAAPFMISFLKLFNGAIFFNRNRNESK